MAVNESKEVDKLVDDLLHRVQRAQGFAFCSDGETFKTKAELFERIRGRLEWNKEASRILSAWLRKHAPRR
jgi:hypothetical protein